LQSANFAWCGTATSHRATSSSLTLQHRPIAPCRRQLSHRATQKARFRPSKSCQPPLGDVGIAIFRTSAALHGILQSLRHRLRLCDWEQTLQDWGQTLQDSLISVILHAFLTDILILMDVGRSDGISSAP